MTLRVLVVGDSYMPVAAFAGALGLLEREHEISYIQLDEHDAHAPSSASDLRIREYTGTPAQIADRIAGIDVLIVHGAPVTAEVLDAADRLRLVGCARGGPVNVDVEELARRGVELITTPGKNAEAVADQTLAFLIMLARRFPRACGFLLDGGRVGDSAFEGLEFFGHDLGGHVLGLVGYGRVGSRVAHRARAFGMSVLAYDPYVQIDDGEGVEQIETLGGLLGQADFVSLHARAGVAGEPLIGAAQLAQMKPGACLVNTAREALIDEQALDAALAGGQLAGAALDVVNRRDTDGRHPLLRHDNVVLTPHIGGATHETLTRGAMMIAEELGRFAAGEPLRYRVELAGSPR
jgi:D-3-phosphoglycerate dehydrogenase